MYIFSNLYIFIKIKKIIFIPKIVKSNNIITTILQFVWYNNLKYELLNEFQHNNFYHIIIVPLDVKFQKK